MGGSSGYQLDFGDELQLDFQGAQPGSPQLDVGGAPPSALSEGAAGQRASSEGAAGQRASSSASSEGAGGQRALSSASSSASSEGVGGQLESGSAQRLAVYTDGSCLVNPGPGGWAWVVPEDQDAPEAGRKESGSEAETTSQRMELTAVLKALDSLRDAAALDVYSDSRYVVDCFEKRWWEGWMRRGWRTSSKQPVKNQDLWRPLLELALKRDVEFHWVKAHYGNRWNELADFLANEAARRPAGG